MLVFARTRGYLHGHEKQVWAYMSSSGIFGECPRRHLCVTAMQPCGEMESRRVMPTSVSVIGMGKLGAPMAAAMAARGIRAIGVDSDAAKVEAIERGMPPAFQPRLAETLNFAP